MVLKAELLYLWLENDFRIGHSFRSYYGTNLIVFGE